MPFTFGFLNGHRGPVALAGDIDRLGAVNPAKRAFAQRHRVRLKGQRVPRDFQPPIWELAIRVDVLKHRIAVADGGGPAGHDGAAVLLHGQETVVLADETRHQRPVTHLWLFPVDFPVAFVGVGPRGGRHLAQREHLLFQFHLACRVTFTAPVHDDEENNEPESTQKHVQRPFDEFRHWHWSCRWEMRPQRGKKWRLHAQCICLHSFLGTKIMIIHEFML